MEQSARDVIGQDPAMRDTFAALPPLVQVTLRQSRFTPDSADMLRQAAEHLMSGR